MEPARRLVCWANGGNRELEPRVMQVLVALASAPGQVVSRDRLIELCWEGRIVGDDAINRCIQGLRRLSRDIDPAAFAIETVPRVGYSLIPNSSQEEVLKDLAAEASSVPLTRSQDPATEVPAAAQHSSRFPAPMARKSIQVAVPLLLLAVASIALLQLGRPQNSVRTVAIEADDPGASGIARDLEVDLARLAGARADEMSLVESVGGADLLARVSAGKAGEVVRANLKLVSGGSGELLWSAVVELPAQKVADLRPQVAAKLGGVLLCALDIPNARNGLDAATARLYVSACEQIEQSADEQQLAQLRQVTERAPDFAQAWAHLAFVEAEMYFLSPNGNPAALPPQALRDQAREHLLRARAMNENLGATYAAEAALLPAGQWAAKIAVLEKGISRDPDNARLHERLSRALFEVGRTADAVNAARQAAVLNPLSPRSRASLILNLAHAGNAKLARRELEEAERIWPSVEDIRNARFSIELRYGDPQIAQRMIDRGEASLGGPTGGFGGPQMLMQARLYPTPENVSRMVHFASRQTQKVPGAVALRIQALGHAGATHEAYDMMEQPGILKALRGATDVLFRPHLRDFRYDPRFMRLAQNLGLLDYWQKNDAWPDFCSDPRLPYDCRAGGERLPAAAGKA